MHRVRGYGVSVNKSLDDFPPAARTVTEHAMRARQLVNDAMRACAALNESLTEEQGHACEHLISYAHDGLYSALGYLEQVERRLRGEDT
jgi:hypothetical protein